MIMIPILILTIIVSIWMGTKLDAVLRCGRPTKMFGRYEHHGTTVWVREDLRGQHRDHCLCFDCKRFHPGSAGNCKIAQSAYEACVEHNIVTPVWECPVFVQDPFAADRKHNQ
jgi:hypothetical protein